MPDTKPQAKPAPDINVIVESYGTLVDTLELQLANEKAAKLFLSTLATLESQMDTLKVLPGLEALGATAPVPDAIKAEVAKLVSTPGQSTEHKAIMAKVEAAITVADVVGMTDETKAKAEAAVKRHKAMYVAQGGNGGTQPSRRSKGDKSRKLRFKLLATGPGIEAHSGALTGFGDWGNLRWQINVAANDGHGGVSYDDLSAILPQLYAVDDAAAKGEPFEPVDVTVYALDGAGFRVQYPDPS